MNFEYWWKTTGIASMGMQPGDVYRAARDTALAAWEAATKAEREACARVCEAIEDEYQQREGLRYPELKTDAQTGAGDCAAAILARSET